MRRIQHNVFLGELSSFPSNSLGVVTSLDPGSRWSPTAFVFHCYTCGKVYGGRVPIGVDCASTFLYITRYCEAHGDGSLLEREDDLDSIPPELAMYEIAVPFIPGVT